MANTKETIEILRSKGKERSEKFIKQYKENNNPGNPAQFQDSTFLFIRSFEKDIGFRNPGITEPSGKVFWLSPDINLFDNGGNIINKLQEGGQTYTVEVTIRNSGDLSAYSCTVELYISNPSYGKAFLGFSLDAPSTILLGIQPAEVMAGAITQVSFPFKPKRPNIGHQVILARVHSLVYGEIPVVTTALNPYHNRHDAQKNLLIVGNGV